MSLLVSLEEQIDFDRFWNLELLGIQPEEIRDLVTSYHQHRFSFREGKYMAKLPWKLSHPALASTYSVSRRRTFSTISRLEKQKGSLAIFDGIIQDQLEKRYIEIVPEEEIYQQMAHYNPLLGVIKKS